MEEQQPEVRVNGILVHPSDYEIKDGVIMFFKPLIELAPNPELDKRGKYVFQISVKLTSTESL